MYARLSFAALLLAGCSHAPLAASIQGAKIGAKGAQRVTLTIPAAYRVPSPPGSGAMPFCSKTFTYDGSLATHYMPLMHLAWGPQQVGYGDRAYKYDPRLLKTPPPMFPTTGPWQVSTWKDANPQCLDSGHINNPECG